jgi:ribosomal protein S27E
MSKFLRVRCDCGEETTVFGDSKTSVNCKKCGNQIIKAAGGRALINCRILEVLS